MTCCPICFQDKLKHVLITATQHLDYNYKAYQHKVNAHNRAVNNLIEEYILEESGLNTIPEQYRDKVGRYAYDVSHSSGHYEVYQTLCELVKIFN